jgi:hypothetical protein
MYIKEMDKVTFLDIDGVLNTGGKRKLGQLDKNLVSKLNDLKTYFVLISSWGLYYKVNQIQVLLESKGFNNKLHSYLFGDESREEKIISFIKNHNVKNYVVLDDRVICKNNLVKINPKIGLTDEDILTAKKILKCNN